MGHRLLNFEQMQMTRTLENTGPKIILMRIISYCYVYISLACEENENNKLSFFYLYLSIFLEEDRRELPHKKHITKKFIQ